MNSARITSCTARAAVDGVSAGHGHSPDGLDETAIDALLAEIDQELTTATTVAEVRTRHAFTDTQHAHRTRRRTNRAALRVLPARLDTTTSSRGEAA
jgi:hypothetical protein